MNRNLLAVEVAGMQGVGLTKTEAKADAMERLSKAMEGSYAPVILMFPCNISAVIYRTPTYYGYVLTSHEKTYPGRCHDVDFLRPEHAERACRAQAAQWLEGRTIDDGMSAVLDEDDQYRHARYVGFQRAYRYYRAQGMNENECHWHACQNELDFMPREEQPALFA